MNAISGKNRGNNIGVKVAIIPSIFRTSSIWRPPKTIIPSDMTLRKREVSTRKTLIIICNNPRGSILTTLEMSQTMVQALSNLMLSSQELNIRLIRTSEKTLASPQKSLAIKVFLYPNRAVSETPQL